MKSVALAGLAALISASAFAECTDMTTTPGIKQCLEFRTTVAEDLIASDIATIDGLLGARDPATVKKLMATQKAWLQLRNASCGFATSKMTGSEEEGITELSCRLAETLKRVKELEAILDDVKDGSNKSFREAISGLVEIRDPSVSKKKIASPFGVSLINREFNAAQGALMGVADVKENRLRIKSLRIVDEGTQGVCGKASVYVAELGYYAQKTQKYMKIFVRSDLGPKREVLAIKTSVQENIESEPVCP